MDDQTKQFTIRVAAVATALAALFGVFVYINALWEGKAVFPEQLANAIIGLLVFATTSASVWLHSRNSIKTRQVVLDSTAEIKNTMVDGGGEIIAEKVVAAVEPMIRDPERRHPATPNDNGSRHRGTDPQMPLPGG